MSTCTCIYAYIFTYIHVHVHVCTTVLCICACVLCVRVRVHLHVPHADLIRDIKDPEHPHTLEELNVVSETCITVLRRAAACSAATMRLPLNHESSSTSNSTAGDSGAEDDEELWIRIVFTPTVPHCSLATLIGLCIRVKLERQLEANFKLDIAVSEGTHAIEGDVNKQINDKERVAAAMENPGLREMVEECIKDAEY